MLPFTGEVEKDWLQHSMPGMSEGEEATQEGLSGVDFQGTVLAGIDCYGGGVELEVGYGWPVNHCAVCSKRLTLPKKVWHMPPAPNI